jgi:hypothetical protein
MGSVTPTASKASNSLSNRGQNALELGKKRITWDIISDMWHPENNPDGYLSVGMAENTLLHSTLVEYIRANLDISA